MATTFPYNDSEYEPAAPILRLLVSVPAAESSSVAQAVLGLCDTGADMTCVPRSVVETLGLIEVDEVKVAAYDGRARWMPVYAARVSLAGRAAPILRVLSLDSGRAIVGRDFLNRLRLDLDGPARTLTVLGLN